jgi:membrane protein DedA with SNARE-associated domain
MPVALALILATLVSEDLTCISAGLLIHHGQLDAFTGVIACTVGIFIGDCGLWAIGRGLGVAAFESRWLRRVFEHRRVADVRAWLDRHAAKAIVATRFLPGTRMPFYLTAGVAGTPFRVFGPWDLLACLLWAPLLVMLTATLGDAFAARLSSAAGNALLPSIAAAVLVVALLYVARVAASRSRRSNVAARLARWSRWEFWPMWLFYGPVALWVALLAIRHRGLSTMTAANPGMADGGTVGESKAEILEKLPRDVTVPFALIAMGSDAARLEAVRNVLAREGWTFPLILKPMSVSAASGSSWHVRWPTSNATCRWRASR